MAFTEVLDEGRTLADRTREGLAAGTPGGAFAETRITLVSQDITPKGSMSMADIWKARQARQALLRRG